VPAGAINVVLLVSVNSVKRVTTNPHQAQLMLMTVRRRLVQSSRSATGSRKIFWTR